ncbi:MAG: TetR/AcrR family transcriptional regulator, partial [Candidatus Hodarchaeota archaeon]
TRIKDITKKAGTSVGNFYNYFKSKEEIFEVIISGLAELMVSKFKELFIYFQENRIPPISAVKNLFRGYAKIFKAKKETFLIFLEQMGGINNKYRMKRNEIIDNFTDEVEKIMIKLVEFGAREQNPTISARVWTSTVLGVFNWWIRSDFALEEEKLVDNLTDFLVRGTMTD